MADGVFSEQIAYTVLDHAAGDFVGATGPHTLDIDFGTLLLGVGSAGEVFQLTNLASSFRAGLDFNSVLEVGDGANRFDTDLAAFSNLRPVT